MERPIKLHLGSGNKIWPGWTNCDSDYDLKDLPFKNVNEIQAIHLFEHLPRLEVEAYLSHWYSLLEEGGKLILEMPSMDKIAKMIVEGETNPKMTLLGIFGDESYNDPLMLHRWCYTQYELDELLIKQGFKTEFKDPVFHYPNRDLRVEATK